MIQFEGMAEKDFARLEQFIHRIALSIAHDFGEVRKSIGHLADRISVLEKRVDDGFKRVDVRFDVVEGKIDALDRRIDEEIEARHKLGDRLSKVEVKLKI